MSGHGQHPFDEYFARDFVSGADWWRDYGSATREFTISGIGTRQSWDEKQKKKIPKPVMFLVEHGDKAIFINRTNHERLQELFGGRYFDNDGAAVRGKTLKIRCTELVQKTQTMHIIEIVGAGEQGSDAGRWADRFLTAIGNLGLALSDFIWWLGMMNQKQLADTLRGLACEDWPEVSRQWMKRYIDEANREIGNCRKP